MTSGVTYRKAGLGDLRAIAAMERRYFGRHAYGAGMLLYLLLHAAEGFRVAELAGEVVGYVVVRRESVRRSRAEIPTFAVRQDMRGRGIGTALVTQALEHLRRESVRRVRLQVSVHNAGARRLYERLGFRVDRTMPAYYGEAEDALLMVCALDEGSDASPG